MGLGPMELVVFLAYLVPLAGFVFFVMLAFRFVRAAERVATALEDIARRPGSPLV